MGKVEEKLKRKKRIRSRVNGTKERPRLAVYRSNAHIYTQVINDAENKTLISASEKDLDEKESKKMNKTQKAKEVGMAVAKKALKVGLKQVVYDRGGYRYHGRVKALAEGAREGGLDF
ncbi:MAG: 50S ribosomal protein L18 [Candidatus Woesebacteria bacterium GW2011_GWB1_38_8b]|uniref:Large ribosomal subunit protein uL18 n=1 Tax=Candidatus Woesebacteria bacterium GW2011_GWB1_38_8b TaxID=1618571 RepID=A0A0G0PEJ6_9BACT|nr:MAG: 50S ribosomal protein L18 [Candidatus Woesebacteria bacterium GW2011_GWB1_38_8b]